MGIRLLQKFLVLTIILILNLSLNAQEYLDKATDNRTAFGLFGGVGLNQHSADFVGVDFPQVPSCCPRYETGMGIGFNAGLLLDLPMSNQLTLQFRGMYKNLNGTLSKDEETYVSTPDGSGTEGTFEHSVEGTFATAGLNALLGFRVSDYFLLSAGLSGAYLLDKGFSQKEELTEPSFGTFYGTNKRVRNEYSGDLAQPVSVQLGLVVGGAYYLPLNGPETIYLVPEVYYTYGLTDFAENVKWNANQLSGGIALKWAPRKVKPPKLPSLPPPPPPLPLPPPPPTMPVLNASIVAVAVDNKGNESPIAQLKVEQFLSTRMHPLMNYIFFEENTSTIPPRYKQISKSQTADFSQKALYSMSTLDVYYNILNILGERLSKTPQAEITLIGCNANINAEAGNVTLSRNRAQSIKDYMIRVWGIADSRIKVQERNLPENPSNVTTPDGQAENRRVEIVANTDRLFEPIIVQDTLIESNPPVFRFKPQINAQMGINQWKIITSQSLGDLKTFSGTGKPPTTIEWDLAKEYEVVPKLNEPLKYRLEVVDNDNKKWSSQVQSMPVEQYTLERKILEQIEDKEIDRFSLILFGFDKSELGSENQRITDFAKRRIYPNSTVKITGYSDRIGDVQHNLELSQRRAASTAKALGVDQKFAKGVGNSILLYDNSLPEGRFYCRTVNIEIITPIKYE